MASSEECVEDSRFQEILRMEGIDLQQFFQEVPVDDLLPPATSYPAFFNENLVSPNRILKQLLNNPQSNIRVFYFQILRLGYEIQQEGNANKNFIVSLRRIIFHPEFEILFTQETENERDLFNDFQFKRLFAQFTLLLDQQQHPLVQQILGHYPIMDSIFIHIFRSLLASQNINEEFDVKIPSEVVFTQLCTLLDLNITSYGNCWKFEDSDMFCYEESQNELFLAYIVEDGEVEDGAQGYEEQQAGVGQYGGYQANEVSSGAGYTNSNNISPANNTYNNGYGGNQAANNVHGGNLGLNPQRVETTNNYPTESKGVDFKMNEYFSSNEQVNSSFKPEPYSQQNTSHFQPPKYEQPRYESPKYQAPKYQPPRYEVPRYQPPRYQAPKYQAPKYEAPRYQPPKQQYKPYQPPQYNPYPSSNYQPVEYIPATVYNPEPPSYVSTFKPVEATPMPVFDTYKPYEPKKDYIKPSTSYEPSYNSYNEYKVESTYGSSVFDKDYKSPVNYSKPNYTSGVGDYYGDFTPPEILARLKGQNRDNINKIRESMKNIFKGGQLPADFDVRKSAIHNTSTSTPTPKEDLRNPSRSQFDYNDSYKYSASSKPLTADLSSYMVNKPPPAYESYSSNLSTNYQSSYGNYSAY